MNMSKEVIVGNWKLIKRIGEGGCAYTYLGEHIHLPWLACLKQNIDVNPADTEALKREALILSKIHHHSLPTLVDWIPLKDGSHMIAMMYIEGKDLFKVVKEDYPTGVEAEHVCWMTQRLLNALHYLHYHGIIHNDVKPQNIIIQPDTHNAVLVDLGISSVRPKRMTASHGLTEVWTAPELVKYVDGEPTVSGLPPTPESDLYGLGMSMLYALGGHIGTKTFPDTVAPELQQFFSKMILHDPAARPKSAEELIVPLSDLREKLFGRRKSGLKPLIVKK
jgi:serine/threonine protein kinase